MNRLAVAAVPPILGATAGAIDAAINEKFSGAGVWYEGALTLGGAVAAFLGVNPNISESALVSGATLLAQRGTGVILGSPQVKSRAVARGNRRAVPSAAGRLSLSAESPYLYDHNDLQTVNAPSSAGRMKYGNGRGLNSTGIQKVNRPSVLG